MGALTPPPAERQVGVTGTVVQDSSSRRAFSGTQTRLDQVNLSLIPRGCFWLRTAREDCKATDQSRRQPSIHFLVWRVSEILQCQPGQGACPNDGCCRVQGTSARCATTSAESHLQPVIRCHRRLSTGEIRSGARTSQGPDLPPKAPIMSLGGIYNPTLALPLVSHSHIICGRVRCITLLESKRFWKTQPLVRSGERSRTLPRGGRK